MVSLSDFNEIEPPQRPASEPGPLRPPAGAPPAIPPPPSQAPPPVQAQPSSQTQPLGQPLGYTPLPPPSKSSHTWLWVGLGLFAVLVLILGVIAAAILSDDRPDAAPTTSTLSGGSTGTDEAGSPTTNAVDSSTDSATDGDAGPMPLSVAKLATSTVMVVLVDDDDTPLCFGSGTIVDDSGLILTNAHVIANSSECPYSSIIVAVTEDSSVPPTFRYRADLLAVDTPLDLAVVRASTNLDGSAVVTPFEPTAIGDSDDVQIGDSLRILGYPSIGGDTITFTVGSVSGFTSQTGFGTRSWIKTDATIAGGNSGGTALNDDGELVGIPTQGGTGADSPIVDCRVLTDTNGDGVIDDDDQCVPFGGFLNGIRPVNLALPLLAEAATAEPMEFASEVSASDFELQDLYFNNPRFSLGPPAENAGDIGDVEFIATADVGATELCFWFDFTGMVDGVGWDVVWLVDDEFVEEYGIFEQVWEHGEEGQDIWACASDTAGLDPGLYEVAFVVNGETAFIEAIEVTSTPVPVHTVTVVNDGSGDLCFLIVDPEGSTDLGLDEFGSTEYLEPSQRRELRLPEGVSVVQAFDCEGDPVGQGAISVEVAGDQVLSIGQDG